MDNITEGEGISAIALQSVLKDKKLDLAKIVLL